MPRSIPIRILLPLLLHAAVPVATAQPTDYETPRSMALGTGVAASARSTSAGALAAAALPWLRAYHVEAAGGYAPSGPGGWWAGGAVADSITNRLAASLSGRGVFGLGASRLGGADARLALGLPLSERVSLGFGLRYVNLTPDQTGEGTAPGVSGFTVDASLGVRPTDAVALVLFGRNLVDRGDAWIPRQLGGSAAFALGEVFSVGVDAWAEWNEDASARMVLGGGVEYFAGAAVPLRLGYRYEGNGARHYLSGGIGYVESRVAVDVSLRQGVQNDSGTELALAFRYHVQ